MNGGKFVNCGEFMDEKMIWIASRTFTDEHIGKALTDAEMAEREEWEKEYSYEIREVSKIVGFSEVFKQLDFFKKIIISYTLIEGLKMAKSINSDIKTALVLNYFYPDEISQKMQLLSYAKETYAVFVYLSMYITMLPEEITLLDKNISNLEKYLSDIANKLQESINEEVKKPLPSKNTIIKDTNNMFPLEFYINKSLNVSYSDICLKDSNGNKSKK